LDWIEIYLKGIIEKSCLCFVLVVFLSELKYLNIPDAKKPHKFKSIFLQNKSWLFDLIFQGKAAAAATFISEYSWFASETLRSKSNSNKSSGYEKHLNLNLNLFPFATYFKPFHSIQTSFFQSKPLSSFQSFLRFKPLIFM
jgi:hypothetical protein